MLLFGHFFFMYMCGKIQVLFIYYLPVKFNEKFNSYLSMILNEDEFYISANNDFIVGDFELVNLLSSPDSRHFLTKGE